MEVETKRFLVKLLGGLSGSVGHAAQQFLQYDRPDLHPIPDLNKRIASGVPSYGSLVTTGVPAAAGVVMRRSRNLKVHDVGHGLAAWGAPRLLHQVVMQAVYDLTPRGPGFSHRASAPYVTKAERLPFQTDFTY